MSKHLNADTLIEALESPSIVIAGKTYTAKVLSFRDAVKLQHTLSSLEMTEPDVLFNFVNQVCDKTGLPADELLNLPAPVFTTVLEDFFSYLISGKNA